MFILRGAADLEVLKGCEAKYCKSTARIICPVNQRNTKTNNSNTMRRQKSEAANKAAAGCYTFCARHDSETHQQQYILLLIAFASYAIVKLKNLRTWKITTLLRDV